MTNARLAILAVATFTSFWFGVRMEMYNTERLKTKIAAQQQELANQSFLALQDSLAAEHKMQQAVAEVQNEKVKLDSAYMSAIRNLQQRVHDSAETRTGSSVPGSAGDSGQCQPASTWGELSESARQRLVDTAADCEADRIKLIEWQVWVKAVD